MNRRMLIVAIAVVGLLTPLAYAKQPHMDHALKALENAKAQLEKAEEDKGGHRHKAMELIDHAIAEVQAGIEYDKTHPEQPKK